MLATVDLNYFLPPGAIATHPTADRSAARLLVISRSDPTLRHDARVVELPEFLRSGDCLILNTTRVLPARLAGYRADTGGRVGGLYLRSATETEWSASHGVRAWVVLLHGKTLRPGVRVCLFANGGDGADIRGGFEGAQASSTPFQLSLLRRHEDETGGWVAALLDSKGRPTNISDQEMLEAVGLTPLPPYIFKARREAALRRGDVAGEGCKGPGGGGDALLGAAGQGKDARVTTVRGLDAGAAKVASGTGAGSAGGGELRLPRALAEPDEKADRLRYQTVYAGELGSVAAPTAGLHLTPELMERLVAKGISRGDVLLHVGTGTFKSVETEFVEQHPMHSEWCSMPAATRDLILATRGGTGVPRGRVMCVGTTSARTVEAFATRPDLFEQMPGGGARAEMETRLLITPGYDLKWMDGLLTNFHLPRSTLLAMVGSLLPGGVAQLKEHYAYAIEQNYRFYSYGDAMLVLP